ncbi:MAG: hypothetical protein P8Z38_08790 [Robiginitalea sp.]
MYRLSLFWMFLLCLAVPQTAYFQESDQAQMAGASEDFFSDQAPLKLSLTASVKSLKRETNDSTYLEGTLRFTDGAQDMDSVDLRVRARGNFRRSQCYFAPLKLKFRKSDIRGTLFEGHQELKLVLPCLMGSQADDYVLKEYLAYKLFEVVSPYHYKTRLATIAFTELKGRRERTHELTGFLIEDHSTLAKRLDGKRIRRNMPPQMQDPRASVRNNLFQYGIGNTDFSLRLQHNQKLYYIDGKYISIPYDFDMAGLVNAPYATVSNVQSLSVQITHVTERAYKGYVRDSSLVQEVRREFLDARPGMIRELELLEPMFGDHRQYAEAAAYLEGFFDILADDRKFEREILRHMRE